MNAAEEAEICLRCDQALMRDGERMRFLIAYQASAGMLDLFKLQGALAKGEGAFRVYVDELRRSIEVDL